MGAVDRLVASLVSSEEPIERSALRDAAARLRPTVAPLAGPEIIDTAVDALVGVGPLESLVADDSVSDVLVNAFDDIWVERSGISNGLMSSSGRPMSSLQWCGGSSHHWGSALMPRLRL